MGFYGINFLGVLVASIAAMIVGMLWYSEKVFGKQWMKLSGISKKKLSEAKEKGMAKQLVVAFLANIIMASVLSVFLAYSGAITVQGALIVGFLLWLGMMATIQINSVLWEGKPVNLFVLNTLNSLVVLEVMAIVLHLLG